MPSGHPRVIQKKNGAPGVSLHPGPLNLKLGGSSSSCSSYSTPIWIRRPAQWRSLCHLGRGKGSGFKVGALINYPEPPFWGRRLGPASALHDECTEAFKIILKDHSKPASVGGYSARPRRRRRAVKPDSAARQCGRRPRCSRGAGGAGAAGGRAASRASLQMCVMWSEQLEITA